MANLILEQFNELTFDKLKNFISDEFGLNEESDILKKAYDLADKEHQGQLRKNGLKYITHPEAVAELASILGLPTSLIIIAFLHDTYEDSKDRNATENNIIKNFDKNTANLVKILSHDKGEKYFNYVKKLLLNSKTKKLFLIKICDMVHNSSDGFKQKYSDTLIKLEQDITTNKEIEELKSYYPLLGIMINKIKGI